MKYLVLLCELNNLNVEELKKITKSFLDARKFALYVRIDCSKYKRLDYMHPTGDLCHPNTPSSIETMETKLHIDIEIQTPTLSFACPHFQGSRYSGFSAIHKKSSRVLSDQQ